VAHDFDVHVSDATGALATIGVMGPRSRQLLSRVSPVDWSNSAQPLYTAREVEVGDGFAWVLRLSYVGELGYEIYVPTDLAVNVYEALWEEGLDLGVQAAGFFALDSLRLEKGYRHLGHDIGATDDPFSAGLGFAVDLDKDAEFIGEKALRKLDRSAPKHRTVHVAIEDPNVMFVHDESVMVAGERVGRLTSGGFGHTMGRSVGIAAIDPSISVDSQFTVRCKGKDYPLTVSAKPFYDPGNLRMIDAEEVGDAHARS
jgi:4-methylaminobutanoate oxidase (formaldehyde-forming)